MMRLRESESFDVHLQGWMEEDNADYLLQAGIEIKEEMERRLRIAEYPSELFITSYPILNAAQLATTGMENDEDARSRPTEPPPTVRDRLLAVRAM